MAMLPPEQSPDRRLQTFIWVGEVEGPRESCRGWGACGVVVLVGQSPRRQMVLPELDCWWPLVDWLWCLVWCWEWCLRSWQVGAALEAAGQGVRWAWTAERRIR